jgi:hypothetical protein
MANPDFEQLLDALLPFAQQMLAKNGEFYPFGATIDTSGKPALAASDTGSEQPESEECIDLLSVGFREQAKQGAIRACGICYDVRTIPPGQTEKVDAICIAFEHNSGEAIHVMVPYRKGLIGRIKYGELFACKGEKTIFGNE